jgi:hypothetical protein
VLVTGKIKWRIDIDIPFWMNIAVVIDSYSDSI